MSHNIITPEKMGDILMNFLGVRDQLKIYHFQTSSYSRHKAVDDLVNTLTEKLDLFMEILQGSRNMKLRINNNHNYITFKNIEDKNIVMLLHSFKKWLINGLSTYIKPLDTDLITLRDDMLGGVNQTLYLFTLK